MKHRGGIFLSISSPVSQISRRMVGSVSLPGKAGSFTVLEGHAPLITSLKEGDIVYTEGGTRKSVHVKSGFAEVADDNVTVCVEI